MESMPTLFHIPLPSVIGKKTARLTQLKEAADKIEANKEDVLLLFHDTGAFRSEIYLSTSGTVPEANNVTLNGKFVSRVFNGPYGAVPKFMKEMETWLSSDGLKALDYYIQYAYCPKCAKKFGANYMILFAKTGS